MKVLLNKKEARLIGLRFNNNSTTYRIKKQDHQIFKVSKRALNKAVGERKGILVRRAAFPAGIRAYPDEYPESEEQREREKEWNEYLDEFILQADFVQGAFRGAFRKWFMLPFENKAYYPSYKKENFDGALREVEDVYIRIMNGMTMNGMTMSDEEKEETEKRFPKKELFKRLRKRHAEVHKGYRGFKLRESRSIGENEPRGPIYNAYAYRRLVRRLVKEREAKKKEREAKKNKRSSQTQPSNQPPLKKR